MPFPLYILLSYETMIRHLNSIIKVLYWNMNMDK